MAVLNRVGDKWSMLTALGASLREPVQALGAWATEHIACIRTAQERFDAERADA